MIETEHTCCTIGRYLYTYREHIFYNRMYSLKQLLMVFKLFLYTIVTCRYLYDVSRVKFHIFQRPTSLQYLAAYKGCIYVFHIYFMFEGHKNLIKLCTNLIRFLNGNKKCFTLFHSAPKAV